MSGAGQHKNHGWRLSRCPRLQPPWSGLFDVFVLGLSGVAIGVIPFMWVCGVFHYG